MIFYYGRYFFTYFGHLQPTGRILIPPILQSIVARIQLLVHLLHSFSLPKKLPQFEGDVFVAVNLFTVQKQREEYRKLLEAHQQAIDSNVEPHLLDGRLERVEKFLALKKQRERAVLETLLYKQ